MPLYHTINTIVFESRETLWIARQLALTLETSAFESLYAGQFAL